MNMVPRGKNLAAGGLFIIALFTVFSYARIVNAPFVFEDGKNIVENQSIRNIAHPFKVLKTEPGSENTGRPFANLTLSLNYAAGGASPTGYRVTNIFLHLLTALLFFLVTRRTLGLMRPQVLCAEEQVLTLLALIAAAIFALHPLQTAAVTYVSRRGELLAGLSVMAALYFSIRGWETQRERPWHYLATAAMLVGVMSGPTTAAAPFLVLLYDRSFVHSSVLQSIRTSKTLYAGFFISLVVFALLTASKISPPPSEAASHLSLDYALFQSVITWRYVRLFFIPVGLCFNYHGLPAPYIWQSVPSILMWISVIAAVLWGIAKRRPSGFWGACFLLLMAPSSSFFPFGEIASEHRIYTALAALSVLSILGLINVTSLLFSNRNLLSEASSISRLLMAFLTLSAILMFASISRNGVYENDLALWKDTVKKAPYNALAHLNLGAALRAKGGDIEREIQCYGAAVAIEPKFIEAAHNLAGALTRAGRYKEALAEFRRILTFSPNDSISLNGLGIVLSLSGNPEEAVKEYRKAIAEDPKNVMAFVNLGKTLLDTGRLDEAGEAYAEAVRLSPKFAPALAGFGDYHSKAGDIEGAVKWYSNTLTSGGEFPDVLFKLGVALSQLNRQDQAIACYMKAIQLVPDFFEAHYNLGNSLLRMGDLETAIFHLNRATVLRPDYEAARQNLEIAKKLMNSRPNEPAALTEKAP